MALCRPLGASIREIEGCKSLKINVVKFVLFFIIIQIVGQKKESSEGITIVYRSMWKVTKGKKVEVAMKILKQDKYDQYLKVSTKIKL